MAASFLALSFFLFWQVPEAGGDLEKARDAQNRGVLERFASQFAAATDKQANDVQAQYRLALAESYLAEIAMQTGDKNQARAAAETGMKAAEKVVSLKPDVAEYHRIWGTLCAQVIPANVILGMKYGHCAQDEVKKAVDLDPKASANYLSRGVGNYYLPSALGGGVDVAIKDFMKAQELDPRSFEAHLWMGIALRKANRNADAHKELQKAVDLNPASTWAKQQLAKTPAS